MQLPPLGPRGEGWTAVQVLLMFAIIVAGYAGRSWPDEASSFLRDSGIVIGIAGWVLFVGGFVGFRGSPSPFPRPREGSRLHVGGAYRLVRHPIYGGLILITLGWSLASSPLALAATVALTLVLEGKSRLEESMLAQRFRVRRVHAKGPMAVRPACSLRHIAHRPRTRGRRTASRAV